MNEKDATKGVDRRDIAKHLRAAPNEPAADQSNLRFLRSQVNQNWLRLPPDAQLLVRPQAGFDPGPAINIPARESEKQDGSRSEKRRAILVVHGMGQQRPFETINTVASGLYATVKAATTAGGPAPPENIDVGHADIGGDLLPRATLMLKDNDGTDQHVDIFEAYWSPLTEGAVKLRDVFALLVRAGLYGIANCQQTFVRYIYGKPCSFRAPILSLLFLLITLASIVSLAVLNTALVLIPIRQSIFKQSAAWLTDALRQDAVTVFNATAVLLVIFAAIVLVSLLWSRQRRHKLDKGKGISGVLLAASIVSFALLIAALIAGAATLPYLVYEHQKWPGDFSVMSPKVAELGQLIPMSWVAIVAAAAGLLWIVVQLIRRNVVPLLTIVFLLALVGGVVALMSWGTQNTGEGSGGYRNILAKIDMIPIGVLLIAAAVVARSFLIQYVGDVVAYVQSQTLDRFAELRTKIKATVCKTASSIYTHQMDGKFAYDDVVIVGHSLGSVIAYDTLNKLLLDDATGLSMPTYLKVKERTRLFLTFGSPLDKTAFIFASQSANPDYGVSDLLAASKQPLISTEAVRKHLRWANIYSPWDIVSGRLDFYDVPGDKHFKRVENRKDEDALVWLGAHTEYWRNARIYEVLRKHLTLPVSAVL